MAMVYERRPVFIPFAQGDETVGRRDKPTGEFVTVSRDGPFARVTLNKPEVHNAFSEHLTVQLSEARFFLEGVSSV